MLSNSSVFSFHLLWIWYHIYEIIADPTVMVLTILYLYEDFIGLSLGVKSMICIELTFDFGPRNPTSFCLFETKFCYVNSLKCQGSHHGIQAGP